MNRRRSEALAAVWLLGLTTMVAAVSTIPAGSAVAQGIGQASYGGVTFSYDKSLATGVRGQTVASNVGQDGLISEVRPEHILFSFDGYPSKGVWTPRIRVVPLDAYKSAQAGSAIGSAFSNLETYLSGQTGGPPPDLPPVNAARFIDEKVAQVSGAGVSGVRFIASYAQGVSPVTADNITYMFVGLTADRKYYVEGTFPVALSTPLDPAPSPLTTENVQAYNKAVAESLGKTDSSGFVPNLDNLDKMMASIQVNSSTIPGMPTTGAPAFQYEALISALALILLVAGMALHIRAKVRF